MILHSINIKLFVSNNRLIFIIPISKMNMPNEGYIMIIAMILTLIALLINKKE